MSISRNRKIAAGVVMAVSLGVGFVGPGPGSAGVLIPSLVALALAFLAREIYAALFFGAFIGALQLNQGNPFFAFVDLFGEHLIPVVADRWKISVIMFSLMMGGFVELLNRNGSMQALASRFLKRGHSRRRAGLGVFGMGWIIFFDGLANSMLVGKTMRPLTDRAGMSREKLAFIVDSTASPIAAFALISTWIATEMGLILAGFENIGDAHLLAEVSPYALLVQSLPYRFYNYFMLLMVFLTIWLGREFGPMRECEDRMRALRDPVVKPERGNSTASGNIWCGIVPLFLLVGGVMGGLFVEGGGLNEPFSITGMIAVFGRADAAVVFLCATAFASLAAMALSVGQTGSRGESQVAIFFSGMRDMFLPVLILVFAFMLNDVIQKLETAAWMVRFLEGRFPAGLLPGVVFLMAALMSFSTGTSWGTMGILMPLAIPVAAHLTGLQAGTEPSGVLIATIGAVLTGAVFGDHCSPLSDTTIVSAFASGCDTMDHVRTQLPYALVAGGLALFIGYLPVGFGVSPWLVMGTGALLSWGMVWFIGRPTQGGN